MKFYKIYVQEAFFYEIKTEIIHMHEKDFNL